MSETKWYKYFRVKEGKLVSSWIDPDNVVTYDGGERLTYKTKKVTMAPSGSVGIFVTDELRINFGNIYDNYDNLKLYRIFPIGKVKSKQIPLTGQRFVCPGIRIGKLIKRYG